MASSKELPPNSRPLTHRPSVSSSNSSSTLPARQSHSRNGSHSVIGAALNGNHRVTRRKSVTNSGTNMAAVAAAISEGSDRVPSLPIAIGSRRGTMTKSSRPGLVGGSLPSPPASLPAHKFVMDDKMGVQESAIDDDGHEVSAEEAEGNEQKARTRRASDGQPLAKEGRKSNRVELRCEKCGKGYKHSSCLTKHLWEHTPEWSLTSKLLISKHQQVQLLEAASVLVAMNNTAATPPDSARDFGSDRESASPDASGDSDQHDGRSSADTTPPPHQDSAAALNSISYRNTSKRFSSGSGFSRSYQSAPSGGSVAGSVPHNSGFGHLRHYSQDNRPTSSGQNATGQDDRDLAAAVELLSCSFGSSGGGQTVTLPPDAPPVPPLPAQYLDQAVLAGSSFINSFPSRAPESFTRGTLHKHDVKMEECGESVMMDDDDDDRRSSRARSEDDDDGVFGRMEE